MDHQNIARAVRRRIPTACAAMLTGSLAKGGEYAFSDIDVIVVETQRYDHYHYANMVEKDRVLELSLFSYATWAATLEQEALKKNRAYFDMLLEGTVLFDDEGIWPDMVAMAKVYAQAYLPPTASQTNNRLRKIFGTAHKLLKHQGSLAHEHPIANSLAKHIAHLASAKRELMQGHDPYLIQDLAKRGPSEEKALLASYLKAVETHDFAPFAQATLEYLKPYEAFFLNYSTGDWRPGLANGTCCYQATATGPDTWGAIARFVAYLPPADRASAYPIFNAITETLVWAWVPTKAGQAGTKEPGSSISLTDGTTMARTQYPWVPIALGMPAFKSIENALTNLFWHCQAAPEGFEAARMPMALAVTQFFCQDLPASAKKQLCQRYLHLALPLFEGQGYQTIADSLESFPQITQAFHQENRDFLGALATSGPMTAVLGSLGQAQMPFDLASEPFRRYALVDFCYNVLCIKKEERYLAAYAMAAGQPPA